MSGQATDDRAAVRQTAELLRASARHADHRRLLVLTGSRAWTRSAAAAAWAAAGLEEAVWIGSDAPEEIEQLGPERAAELLGRELDGVIFDAWQGFDADAFGAASGVVRGGGLLVLLAPDLEHWPDFDDPDYQRLVVSGESSSAITGRFLARLARVIRDDPYAAVCREGAPAPAVADEPAAEPVRPPDDECRTPDQREAVDAVLRAARGRSRRPSVLSSDRGRGKSAALGIAAAHLLAEERGTILVTAPRLTAAEQVFVHAARLLPGAQASRAVVRRGGAAMRFASPDDLARGRVAETPALVLVDEAAAIPGPLLESMLERYPRIVFATTIHGYEGTGRGFAVRFQAVLDRRTPNWRAVRLTRPVRFAPDDPLEALVAAALLLDARPADPEAVGDARPDTTAISRVDRDALASDDDGLAELFGLLVLAHYRTRPFDLRLMLDAPNIEVYVMRHADRVVGTALIAGEGGLDETSAWRIWAGRTRPHGHLMPESLAAHAGLADAPRLRGARIVRIAVHPAVQGRGLGSRLLDRLIDDAAGGYDYIGSSFGASAELMRFWARGELQPVRVSVRRGSTSGAHSAMVLRALSPAGERLQRRARRRFAEQLPVELADFLDDLDTELAAILLDLPEGGAPAPTDEDWRDLASFAWGGRLAETCLVALSRLARHVLADADTRASLSAAQRDVLILRILQHRPWSLVVSRLGVAGRAEADAVLREAVRMLVERLADADTRALAARLAGPGDEAEPAPGDC